MIEYYTEKNATLIEAAISDMVEDHIHQKKKASYLKTNPC